jgi:dihydrofolate reductase
VVDDAPTAPDPHGGDGRRTREHRAFATMLNEMTKLVFSRTLKEASWKNSRLLPELDPAAIEAMKRQPGKDMIMFGSGSIVSQLTQHRLVDEYQIVVNPILLGDGQSLVRGVAKRLRLELLEAKAYPTGNVRLRYAPQG